MGLVLLLALGAIVFWFVRSTARGVSTAQRMDDLKDAVRERAIRDAFIASPLARLDDIVDAAMDNMAKGGMTVHNRAGLRTVLNTFVPEQVGRYVSRATTRVETTIASLDKRTDRLSIKRGELLEEVLGAINGTLIDEIAAATGENIDNGVGLRGALKTVAKAHFGRMVDERPPDWEPPSTGTLAWPCPGCDLLLRDMGSSKCRACGNVF